MSRTLTRGAAIDLVADAATNGLEALLDLQQHWIGHRDYLPETDTVAELSAMLCGYVDSCAEALQDRRRSGRNPSPRDRTELTAPRS